MAYDKAKVGRRIRSLRAENGISRSTLARLTAIPYPTVTCYERGMSVMGLENASKIADVLGCALDTLACRD